MVQGISLLKARVVSMLPDPKLYLASPERAAFVEQRRLDRQAAAKVEQDKQAAVLAEAQVRKDQEAERVRERRQAARRREQRQARQRRGKKAMMHVARWAFYRAYSERSVHWKDKRNWVDRLVRLVTKQVHDHIADRLGSDTLVKKDDTFYEQAARQIFMYYRKTGDRPPESEIQSEVAFPLA